MQSCILVGALGFVLVYLFPERVIQIFSQDDTELLKVTLRGMEIFMFSLLAEGTVLLTVIYYQSINRVRAALFIYLGKIFVFLLPLLFILPIFFGLDGIWSDSPATECLMMVVALFMLSKEFKFLRHNAAENKHPAGTKRALPVVRETGKAEDEENSRFVTFRPAEKREVL